MARVAKTETGIDDDREAGASVLIGGHLRTARLAKKLSIRELSRRVGISASMISQVELGQAKPSVGTLYAMTRELGISLDAIFDSAPELSPNHTEGAEGPVQRHHGRATIYLASGVRWEALTPYGAQPIDFHVLTYAVGAESCPPDQLIAHGGSEYGYVLSGLLEITLESKKYEVGPGDAVSFESTTPHRLANIGNVPMQAIWVTVGRSNDNRIGES